MKEFLPTAPSGQYIWFERCGQAFAAPMEQLQEVLSAPRLRPLPAAEPALAGLMRLREWVLPVFDPLSLLRASTAETVGAGVVLVLGPPGQPLLGLVAERVGKVVELTGIERLSRRTRLPLAFAGEWESPGKPRMLIISPDSLASIMGFTAAGPFQNSGSSGFLAPNQNN